MPIAGILLRGTGPALYCDTASLHPAVGDRLMVETEHGRLLCLVVSLHETPPEGGTVERFSVVRIATEADAEIAGNDRELARRARDFCRECIRARDLDMKLVDVEVYFNAGKIVFYFTAPARIDFRELLKDLVREYRARIELRQIGVRHETQMIGAVGNCGMVCCCRRFLRKFAPVTIRMAKEQNLFLNPAKISGVCGRLLCCLSYEQENYDAFHRECPRLGKRYQTGQGAVRVLRANMFRNSVHVLNENGEEQEFTLAQWRELEPRRPEHHQPQPQPERREAPISDSGGFLVVSVTPDSLNDPDIFGSSSETRTDEERAAGPPPDPRRTSPPPRNANSENPAGNPKHKRPGRQK